MKASDFFQNWQGKVMISGCLEAVTGLHIGGSQTGIDIGGVDNVIIRQQSDGRPYIPGSSVKGKMRSLTERARNKTLVQVVGGRNPIWQHQCDDRAAEACEVCKVFGLPGQKQNSQPTRLIVRDGKLLDKLYVTQPNGKRILRNWDDSDVSTDLPFSEVKNEVAIDRITSAAMPRPVERVPAGARFGYSMVFDIFEKADKDHLGLVFESMHLLENDYLGGYGSRGSGQISFESVQITWRSKADYRSGGKGTVIVRNLALSEIAEKFETEIKPKLNGAA